MGCIRENGRGALDLIARVRFPDDYLCERGRSGLSLTLPEAGSSALHIGQLLRLALSTRHHSDSVTPSTAHPVLSSLALEIAIGEDNERRALDGELRMLADR